MTKNQRILLASAILIGGAFLYIHRDWFAKERIQISHRQLPAGGLWRRNPNAKAAPAPLAFEFDRKLKLTSVKVIPVAGLETNKYPHAIWDLVSDSNSVPTRGFAYGMRVPGMRPAVKGLVAEPLEPGVKYRLLLEAGSLKAEHDFVPPPRKP